MSPKKWPKPLSLSVFFRAASWSYRLRPAQRTQRRLLDQLWASIACASVTFFLLHPPSLRNMFHGLFCFFPSGFHKFICFEKTDVASMDLSCYFPFVSTALITGYVSESDLMAYRSYPRDVALHGGFIALPFHVLSHENKRAVLLTWILLCVRLGARSWQFQPLDNAESKISFLST